MASNLASQLQKIAETSTSTLSARKQKSLHSTSLLFPPSHAAAQDFETIYSIALEGFLELVALDGRFAVFQRGIFSESSKDIDRFTMTKEENDDLDKSCIQFLELVGRWARLKPALKAIEWLVRRFRVNVYIPIQLLLTFLPHFSQPIFRVVLSIIPQKHFPRPFSFLQSFAKSETAPPRSIFTHALATRPDLFAIFSEYTVELLKTQRDYPLFIKFWASVSVEAIAMMCERTRSTSNKKSSSTNETEEDVITKVLPILAEGLKSKRDPEFQLACYMVIAVLTAKLHELDERVLTGLAEAVVNGLTEDTVERGLACVGILIQEGGRLSLAAAQKLLKIEGLEKFLAKLSGNLRVDRFAAAIVHLTLENIKSAEPSDIGKIESIIADVRISQKQKKSIFIKIAKQAQGSELEQNPEVANKFTEMVTNIAQGTPAGKTGRKKLAALFSETLEEEKVDIDVLELKLGSALRQITLTDDVAKKSTEKKIEKTTVLTRNDAIKALPKTVAENYSFFNKEATDLFTKAAQAFVLSVSSPDSTKSFLQHSIFTSQTTLHTFLARVWTGEYPTLVRVAALQQSREIIEAAVASNTDQDYQAILPYVFLALSNNAQKERLAASQLLSAIVKTYKAIVTEKKKSKAPVLGFKTFYPSNDKLEWALAAEVSKFLEIVQQFAQECVLDASVIARVLRNTLSSSKHAGDQTTTEPLKKSVRVSVLTMLCSHIVTSPFYTTKLKLLRIFSQISNTTCSRATLIAPALQKWADASEYHNSKKECTAEGVDAEAYEKELLAIVSTNDKSDALDLLLDILKKGEHAIQENAAQRIRDVWSSLKLSVKIHGADELFKIAFNEARDHSRAAKSAMVEAASLLKDVDIPRENFESVLEDILAALKSAVPQNATDPKKKKVEDSHKKISVAKVVAEATVALESLANNKVKEEDGSLISVLFNILQELLSAESESGIKIGYVTSLVLDCLLEMIRKVKDGKVPSDLAASVRAEVIVSCIRSSSSPQIHNTALLICAAIADVAPEAVLHSVMPIFTFMGANVLRQDDEYSVYVIEQTIKRIIPPLLRSLQAQGESPVVGAAELLASFIAAFVHVPVHRRQWLYTTLIEALGPEDFLFALVSMLAENYGTSLDTKAAYRTSKSVEKESLKGFCLDVMSHFNTTIQLSAVNMCLQVVRDLLEPKQDGVAQKLFNPRKAQSIQLTSTPQNAATNILDVLSTVLASELLKAQIARNLKATSNTNEQVRLLFTQSLEEILLLAAKYTDPEVSDALARTLSVFLGILATGEFVKVIENLIENNKEQLCQIALGTLRSRVLSEHRLDATARAALVSLAPKIGSIISSSSPVDLKLQCLLCSDAIILKCGKQEPKTVSDLATAIVGNGALKSGKKPLQVAALVSLSSSVGCLGGRIIPLIPQSVPYALGLLNDDAASELYTAAFAYLDELIQAVPSFMSSHLPALLLASAKATTLDLTEDTDEVKADLLDSVAEHTELKNILRVISNIWDTVVKSGEEALTELVTVLKTVVTRSTKSQVQKQNHDIKDFLLKALDLRRTASLDDEDTDSVEQLILETTLQVIYKLNDVLFRPIFTDILDWAAVKTKKDPSSRERRLVTFWNFMYTLSENLKSLFTDYFGIALSNAIETLNAAVASKSLKEDEHAPWAKVLKALHSSFTHDEKDFWHLHFPLVSNALLSLLPLAPTTVIPPLLELLVAAQSEDNFKAVNTALLKLMRDDENTPVRVAGTTALAEVYGRLGEEWIGLLPETVPVLAEVLEDEDENVEKAVRVLVKNVEKVLGEGELEGMLT